MASADSSDLSAAVITAFHTQFGTLPSHIARAPGRVNIIGEHTDYNDGFVLPAAIDRAIYIAGRARDDDKITVQSQDYGGVASFTLKQLEDKSLPHFTRYPCGALWLLGQRQYDLRGMDLTIMGNVPGGAGFSSSAAVEVAMFEIASALLGIDLTQEDKALLGVQVEHQFIGIRSGVMDQMISALGRADHALLIDCRSLETTAVPIPSGVTLMTLDTGKRRELVNSEYGKRREECEEAARLLGVKALRDVTPDQFEQEKDKLPEVIRRRAMHVVYEDVRTLDAVKALGKGDLKAVGQLLNDSHVSLSQLYEVSIKELDIMAELAQREQGCYGARMMGGGFGGAVIALVDDSEVEGFGMNVANEYENLTGLKAALYTAKAGPGSSVKPVGMSADLC